MSTIFWVHRFHDAFSLFFFQYSTAHIANLKQFLHFFPMTIFWYFVLLYINYIISLNRLHVLLLKWLTGPTRPGVVLIFITYIVIITHVTTMKYLSFLCLVWPITPHFVSGWGIFLNFLIAMLHAMNKQQV